MPKEKRYKSKTKVYHVMSRALNKQMLFDDEHDFLVYLNKYLERRSNTKLNNMIYILI